MGENIDITKKQGLVNSPGSTLFKHFDVPKVLDNCGIYHTLNKTKHFHGKPLYRISVPIYISGNTEPLCIFHYNLVYKSNKYTFASLPDEINCSFEELALIQYTNVTSTLFTTQTPTLVLDGVKVESNTWALPDSLDIKYKLYEKGSDNDATEKTISVSKSDLIVTENAIDSSEYYTANTTEYMYSKQNSPIIGIELNTATGSSETRYLSFAICNYTDEKRIPIPGYFMYQVQDTYPVVTRENSSSVTQPSVLMPASAITPPKYMFEYNIYFKNKHHRFSLPYLNILNGVFDCEANTVLHGNYVWKSASANIEGNEPQTLNLFNSYLITDDGQRIDVGSIYRNLDNDSNITDPTDFGDEDFKLYRALISGDKTCITDSKPQDKSSDSVWFDSNVTSDVSNFSPQQCNDAHNRIKLNEEQNTNPLYLKWDLSGYGLSSRYGNTKSTGTYVYNYGKVYLGQTVPSGENVGRIWKLGSNNRPETLQTSNSTNWRNNNAPSIRGDSDLSKDNWKTYSDETVCFRTFNQNDSKRKLKATKPTFPLTLNKAKDPVLYNSFFDFTLSIFYGYKLLLIQQVNNDPQVSWGKANLQSIRSVYLKPFNNYDGFQKYKTYNNAGYHKFTAEWEFQYYEDTLLNYNTWEIPKAKLKEDAAFTCIGDVCQLLQAFRGYMADKNLCNYIKDDTIETVKVVYPTDGTGGEALNCGISSVTFKHIGKTAKESPIESLATMWQGSTQVYITKLYEVVDIDALTTCSQSISKVGFNIQGYTPDGLTQYCETGTVFRSTVDISNYFYLKDNTQLLSDSPVGQERYSTIVLLYAKNSSDSLQTLLFSTTNQNQSYVESSTIQFFISQEVNDKTEWVPGDSICIQNDGKYHRVAVKVTGLNGTELLQIQGTKTLVRNITIFNGPDADMDVLRFGFYAKLRDTSKVDLGFNYYKDWHETQILPTIPYYDFY